MKFNNYTINAIQEHKLILIMTIIIGHHFQQNVNQ